MRVVRACGLIVAFASVALVLVVLRAEQTRCAAAALRHEAHWSAVRREMWNVQSVVARLMSPEQIHRRLDRFNLDVHRLMPSRLEDMRRFALIHEPDWTD